MALNSAGEFFMGNPNIVQAGIKTRFSDTNRPKKPGRKPSHVKQWMKDFDLSVEDVKIIYKNFLFGKTYGDISKILNDPEEREKLPLSLALQIEILTKAAAKGDGRHLEDILSRIVGKPMQGIEISEKRNDIPDYPEERRTLAEHLRKELGLGKPPSEAALTAAEISGKQPRKGGKPEDIRL
jgi:hypothetical protein